MDKTKAVFWLGKLETEQAEARGDADSTAATPSGTEPAIANPPSGGDWEQLDRQLIDDAICLFETAFAFFDQRGDQEAKKLIDHLALSVVNQIRTYIMARSAG